MTSSKLGEYMQLLAEEPAEYARSRTDAVQTMTRFGLSAAEQHTVLTGDPGSIRTEIQSADLAEKPKPIPLQGTEKPKPKRGLS